MSFYAVTAALKLKGLDVGEKFLLVVLGSYANTDNTLWPSQKTLSADTSIAERTIRTHLTSLERKGLIRKEHRSVAGRRTSDFITLLFLPAESATSAKPPAKSAKTTGRLAHKPPAKSAAKPIIEPRIELTRAKPLVPVESQAARAKRQQEMANGLRQLATKLGTKR